MKHFIYTLLFVSLWQTSFTQKPFNQDPGNPNLDFSMGNFNNWQLSWGRRNNPDSVSGAASTSSHTIVGIYGTNWEGNAGTGNMKRVPDGLERVGRFGDPAGSGLGNSRAYKMSYDIIVHPDYPIVFIQLASIMDNTHTHIYNTHYKFALKTASGTYIPTQPCTGIELYPTSNTDPLAQSIPLISYTLQTNPSGNYNYQPWESIALNLSSYAGQTLSLELEHYDCSYGVHGSYTYISAAMRSPYDTFYFCRGASSVEVKPYIPRFTSYQWSTGDTTESITVNYPADGAVYTVDVGSYNQCSTTFINVLKEVKTDADFAFAGGGICNQIQFYDQSATNVGEIIKWEWTFGDASSGAANSDTLQNPLHTYPGPGDYTVSLTVTDTFSCTNTITKTVSVSPDGTVAQIGLSEPSCINASLAFEDITANSSRRTWIIQDRQIEDTSKIIYHSFSQPGSYEVTLIAIGSNGCPDTLTQIFTVNGLPESSIQVIPYSLSAPVTEPSFRFRGFEENAAGYVWDFGYGGATATGQYTQFTYPPEIAEYKVLLKTYNKYGCYDSSAVTVKIMPPDFMIPNAFSPNGDGTNDVFRIVNVTNHILKEFSIYNRYGQRVFYGHKYDDGWDGTFMGRPCDMGTYYYVIRYSLPGDNHESVVKGDLMLIR